MNVLGIAGFEIIHLNSKLEWDISIYVILWNCTKQLNIVKFKNFESLYNMALFYFRNIGVWGKVL